MVASSYCEMLVLTREDLNMVLFQFPGYKARFIRLAGEMRRNYIHRNNNVLQTLGGGQQAFYEQDSVSMLEGRAGTNIACGVALMM